MNQSKFSRRQFLSLTAGASAAAALAACTMPPAQPPAAGTTPEVAAQAPAKEATVIRVHARLGTQGDHFDHFAQKFNEAHPDIFIKPELFADADYFQKLDTMIAGGTVGDAFWIYLGGGFTQYAATGIYAALDDIVKSENYDLGQFYPESVEALRYNGHLYSLPWILNVGSASAVYYNKPLLDAAGVAYPTADWTWDDMTNMAVKLTDEEKGVFGLATTNYYAGSPLAAALCLWRRPDQRRRHQKHVGRPEDTPGSAGIQRPLPQVQGQPDGRTELWQRVPGLRSRQSGAVPGRLLGQDGERLRGARLLGSGRHAQGTGRPGQLHVCRHGRRDRQVASTHARHSSI